MLDYDMLADERTALGSRKDIRRAQLLRCALALSGSDGIRTRDLGLDRAAC